MIPLLILIILGSAFTGVRICFFISDRIQVYFKMKKLVEIDDCPFKFLPKNSDNIVIQLTNDTTLWCDYSFGIRSDGIYGINNIRLLGINGSQSEINNLKAGQSIFPIINAMDKFTSWIKQKPFETVFHCDFAQRWTAMKKNLDNLRYLESELKKKEKKSK